MRKTYFLGICERFVIQSPATKYGIVSILWSCWLLFLKFSSNFIWTIHSTTRKRYKHLVYPSCKYLGNSRKTFTHANLSGFLIGWCSRATCWTRISTFSRTIFDLFEIKENLEKKKINIWKLLLSPLLIGKLEKSTTYKYLFELLWPLAYGQWDTRVFERNTWWYYNWVVFVLFLTFQF